MRTSAVASALLIALWLVTAGGIVLALTVDAGATESAVAPTLAALTQRGVTFARVGFGIGLVGLSCLLLGWRRPRAGSDQDPD